MSIDLNPSESEIDPQKTTTFSQTSQKENPFFVVIKAKQKSLEYHIALSHLLRSYRVPFIVYCIILHISHIIFHTLESYSKYWKLYNFLGFFSFLLISSFLEITFLRTSSPEVELVTMESVPLTFEVKIVKVKWNVYLNFKISLLHW